MKEPSIMRSEVFSIFIDYMNTICNAQKILFTATNGLGLHAPNSMREVFSLNKIMKRAKKELQTKLSLIGISYKDYKALERKYLA